MLSLLPVPAGFLAICLFYFFKMSLELQGTISSSRYFHMLHRQKKGISAWSPLKHFKCSSLSLGMGSTGPQRPFLEYLAARSSTNSVISHDTPQFVPYEELSTAIRNLAIDHPSHLYLGRSNYEPIASKQHYTSLYSRRRHYDPTVSDVFDEDSPSIETTYQGQICHISPTDSKTHLLLHPTDANLVFESRWGTISSSSRFDQTFRRRRNDGAVEVALFTPRSIAEIETILEIIRAAAWTVGGGDDVDRESYLVTAVEEQKSLA